MKRSLIILISVIISVVLISGGYSQWKRTLTIRGFIEVQPAPTVFGAVYGEDISVIEAVYGQDQNVVEIIDIDQSTLQP